MTVRAQVHRVRSFAGMAAVANHPYRLSVPVDGDWLEVTRPVAVGPPRETLRACRGSLLPTSDAPAIVEARALLEESLRRSILTTADSELLALAGASRRHRRSGGRPRARRRPPAW